MSNKLPKHSMKAVHSRMPKTWHRFMGLLSKIPVSHSQGRKSFWDIFKKITHTVSLPMKKRFWENVRCFNDEKRKPCCPFKSCTKWRQASCAASPPWRPWKNTTLPNFITVSLRVMTSKFKSDLPVLGTRLCKITYIYNISFMFFSSLKYFSLVYVNLVILLTSQASLIASHSGRAAGSRKTLGRRMSR